jgi:CubicO group peptidase (beta-lactamase class C family)
MSYSIRNSLVVLIGVFVLFGGLANTLAKTSNPLSAEESSPNQLGWMTGFPPPSDKLIMQPESDFFSFPKLRWTVCHIRELMPTKQVSRGIGDPIPLQYAIDKNIDGVSFTPLGGGKPMTWEMSLSADYTDGILIIHEGKVVYERYFGCLEETGKHAAMSMTKSMTGLLAEILVTEGQLDENAQVASIVPELASSAFGSATVRQVMDMTTALDYSEDYADPEADIWIYSPLRARCPSPRVIGPGWLF